MPREDAMHYVQEPLSVQPLVAFIDMAAETLQDTIGPALLAWSAMYGLNNYSWVTDTTRNFNLPILYGQPMAGKTLIASCAAWLNGCTEMHIASRCTLAFITHWLTVSTMPFVWDDPSSAEDVAQLAVDLGGRAIRGKSTDDPRPPQTGCLVTANFDLSHLLRYFSRLFIINVPCSDSVKQPGKAKELEDLAKDASAAFPRIMKLMSAISAEEVFATARTVRDTLDADLRIVQGIAYPLLVTEKILQLVNRNELMDKVTTYLNSNLYPYYRSQLKLLVNTQQDPVQENRNVNNINLRVLSGIDATIIRGSALGIRKELMDQLWEQNPELILKRGGTAYNKTTRLNGRPTKCVVIPKEVFEEETWQAIVQAVTNQQEAAEIPVQQQEAAEIPVQQAEPAEAPVQQAEPAEAPVQQAEPAEAPVQQAEPAEAPVQQAEPAEAPVHQAEPAEAPVHQAEPAEAPVHQAEPAEAPVQQAEPAEHQVQLAEPAATEPAKPPAEQTEHAEPPAENQAELTEPAVILPQATTTKPKDKCSSCQKKGSVYLLWISCDNCKKWYHKKCTGLSTAQYRKIEKDSSSRWTCASC